MDDTQSVRNPLNLCRREQKTRPLIKYYLLFLLFSFVFFFSLRFGLVLQLPIPPGLSVYGEPDEVTSNIYESIDLQREYINPYIHVYLEHNVHAFLFCLWDGYFLYQIHVALLLPRLLTGHGCFPTSSTSFVRLACFLVRLKPNALKLLHVSQRCNRR